MSRRKRLEVRRCRHWIRSLAIIAVVFVGSVGAFGSELEVRVGHLPGATTNDVVVWATPVDRKMPPSSGSAVMDQKNRMFIPHVLPVQRGTAVDFPNSDNIQHQVYSFSSPKVFELGLYRGKSQKPVIFDKPGLVSLGCNIHDQMSAWIVVVDTPYFAKGEGMSPVVIDGLAAGDYDLMIWYPGMSKAFEPRRVRVADRRSTVSIDLTGN